jgi:hypothetical protein
MRRRGASGKVSAPPTPAFYPIQVTFHDADGGEKVLASGRLRAKKKPRRRTGGVCADDCQIG